MKLFRQYVDMIYGAGFDEGRAQQAHRKPVLELKNGIVIKKWPSLVSAVRKLDVSKRAIEYAIEGKSKSCNGSQWAWEDTNKKDPMI
jgi:hypothetical protein